MTRLLQFLPTLELCSPRGLRPRTPSPSGSLALAPPARLEVLA